MSRPDSGAVRMHGAPCDSPGAALGGRQLRPPSPLRHRSMQPLLVPAAPDPPNWGCKPCDGQRRLDMNTQICTQGADRNPRARAYSGYRCRCHLAGAGGRMCECAPVLVKEAGRGASPVARQVLRPATALWVGTALAVHAPDAAASVVLPSSEAGTRCCRHPGALPYMLLCRATSAAVGVNGWSQPSPVQKFSEAGILCPVACMQVLSRPALVLCGQRCVVLCCGRNG